MTFTRKTKSVGLVLIALIILSLTAAQFFIFPRLNSKASTATNTGAVVNHYLYVFPQGQMDVYNIDNGFSLVKTISLPMLSDVRGVVADPASAMLYISYGGDGGAHGNGSLLKYNLLNDSIVWQVNYLFGVDSPAITPDGKSIYLPDGELSYDGTWHVINTSDGSVATSIFINTGAAAHNTIVSLNGSHAYLGALNYNYLVEVNTSNNAIINRIGPLVNGVRPFTINSADTLAFTTATGYLGFQVSSTTTGKVLYTVPVKGFTIPPSESSLPPSHGISLSPDEKEAYVMDNVNSYVHVFDISGLPNTAPVQIADIPLKSMAGNQSPCAYDCAREGWLLHSTSGQYAFVGDSGDIINTATRASIMNLPTLYNSRVYLEIDWTNGVPTYTTSRYGLGHANGSTGGPTPTPTSTPPPNLQTGPVYKTWYFAEGRVGGGFNEYLSLDNPTSNACQVTITYLYTPDGQGSLTKTLSVTIGAGTRYEEGVDGDLGTSSHGFGITDSAIVTVDNTVTPACTGIVAER
ncbi:MAG TPA: hypothetical protein VNE38_06195, partial [Ktedonobacteraceae bacterium]|nr:hypothetical protein [Ktedonobacteraceae bacterium]